MKSYLEETAPLCHPGLDPGSTPGGERINFSNEIIY